MVRALRDVSRRLSLADLSERMGALGRPILPSGLSKLETGERRVDVDDLVALALALDTTPNYLLLGIYQDEDADLQLTGDVTVNSERAWQWAIGDAPLDDRFGDAKRMGKPPAELNRIIRFEWENRPHEAHAALSVEDVERYRPELIAVVRAVEKAQRAGLDLQQIESYLRMRDLGLQRAAREREGHADG